MHSAHCRWCCHFHRRGFVIAMWSLVSVPPYAGTLSRKYAGGRLQVCLICGCGWILGMRGGYRLQNGGMPHNDLSFSFGGWYGYAWHGAPTNSTSFRAYVPRLLHLCREVFCFCRSPSDLCLSMIVVSGVFCRAMSSHLPVGPSGRSGDHLRQITTRGLDSFCLLMHRCHLRLHSTTP